MVLDTLLLAATALFMIPLGSDYVIRHYMSYKAERLSTQELMGRLKEWEENNNEGGRLQKLKHCIYKTNNPYLPWSTSEAFRALTFPIASIPKAYGIELLKRTSSTHTS